MFQFYSPILVLLSNCLKRTTFERSLKTESPSIPQFSKMKSSIVFGFVAAVVFTVSSQMDGESEMFFSFFALYSYLPYRR